MSTQAGNRDAGHVDVIVAVLVGVIAVIFRYLAHSSFSNDQFVHLARAQAWLAGDWPVRDYTEPGMMLTVGASAVAQALFGETLFPELVLSVLMLGVGAAVTYWVTARLTGSRGLGLSAALLQILVSPRLYAYPKILLYPVLLALADYYMTGPSTKRLNMLAGWTAVAFLFRHDHGLYAAAAGILTVTVVHWREGPWRVTRLAGSFAAMLLLYLTPFLVYVQAQAGLWSYLQLGLSLSRTEALRSYGALPVFHLVRGPLLIRLTSAISPQNAGPWLFYVCWALPVAGLLMWYVRQQTVRVSSMVARSVDVDALVPVLCMLTMLCAAGFLRNDPTARTPDVFGTFPILLGWVVAELFAGRGAFMIASRVVAVLVATSTGAAVLTVGNAHEMATRMGVLGGPRGVLVHAAATMRSTVDWPWQRQWPGDDEWKIARYVHDCTRPGDRLLVTWNAPEFYVFSRRQFVGPEIGPIPVTRLPVTVEPSILESWRRRDVPIVLANVEEYEEFTSTYPRLAEYIASDYRMIGTAKGSDRTIAVYADAKRVSHGLDSEFGWPCFADASIKP